MNGNWHKVYMLHRLMVKERAGKISPVDLERLTIMLGKYPEEIIAEATRLTDEKIQCCH